MANIQKSTFQFLKKVEKNNNREWFQANKDLYLVEHEKVIAFADTLLDTMKLHDNIETLNGKKSLHRIYRDTRFSKDKTPYKTNFGGGMRRATKQLRGGYYYHIEPGCTFVAGGFWGPNKDDLLHIRKHIAADAAPLRKIINSKGFKSTFGHLLGAELKTAPKGFDKAHPNIDLLRKKTFVVRYDFKDAAVHAADFSDQMVRVFKEMRPFFDYMSEILTTNLNGETLT